MRYNLLHKVFGASEVFSFIDGFFLPCMEKHRTLKLGNH